MKTLFESLQEKLNAPQAPLAAQQKSLESVVAAKGGKATTGVGPASSSVGEQEALAIGQGAMGQQDTQAKLAGTQLATTAQQQGQAFKTAESEIAAQAAAGHDQLDTQKQLALEDRSATASMSKEKLEHEETMRTTAIVVASDQKLRELASEKGMSMDNIFRDFETSNKELLFRRDAAQLEQYGFMLFMRDKEYNDEISRIGRERDLTDTLNFQEESQRLILGENLSMVGMDLGFKRALNANQREWNEYLNNMSGADLMSVANAQAKDDAQAAQWAGGGAAAKGGLDYAVKKEAASDTKPAYSNEELASGPPDARTKTAGTSEGGTGG